MGLRTKEPTRPPPWAAPAPPPTPAAAGSRIGLDVSAGQPVRLRLARWYFPGWELTLDGEPAPLEKSPYGSIDVAVPAGDTRVDLVCRAPPVRRWALAASGLTLALWLLVVLRWPRWLGAPATTAAEG